MQSGSVCDPTRGSRHARTEHRSKAPRVARRARAGTRNAQASTTMGTDSVRLYVKGCVLGYKRGLRNQYCSTSLLRMEDVKTQDDAKFYLGKRVAYIYKA